MKITDLRVEGFGVWKRLSLDGLSGAINVFYGRNEAGKTTLMQFVRAVLYGFSSERRERYLPPLHGEDAGGLLRLSALGQTYEVRRSLRASDTPASLGEIVVTSGDGTREGPTRLASLLAGIDESIFSNVFAVGLREIQELATLNDTAAAEQLYKLTGGLDRVSLVDVMQELAASRERLLSASDQPSQIEQLVGQWEKLQAQVEQLAAQTDRWSQLMSHRAALQQEIEEEEAGIRRFGQQARQVEVALQVRELFAARTALEQQLAAIGPLAPLPESALDKLDRLGAKAASGLEQLEKLKQQRQKLKAEALALPLNRTLWAQAPRVEALSEHAPWIAALMQQRETLRTEVAACDKELGICFEQLGASQPASLASLPDVSPRKLLLLREPARSIGEAQRRLQGVRQEQVLAERAAAEATQELETTLVERDQTDLTEALEKAGGLAAKLRRRIQLEDRLEQMVRRRDDLEEDSLDLREHQLLPMHVLAAVGGAFVLGIVLVLAGLVGGLIWSMSGAMGWAFLGCVLTGGAVAAKFILERRAASKLEDCTRQFETVNDQIKQAQRERDTLDRDLPSGGGQLDSRLHAAEAEVESLEKLLPLETRRQTAQERAKTSQTAATLAETELKSARSRWRGALRSIGLPDNLSPKQAQQFARGCGRTAQLRKRRETRLEEFRRRERDLTTLTARIGQLMQEAGLAAESEDPEAQLRQLVAAVATQRQTVARRSVLKKQDRVLKREQAKLRQVIENLRRRRSALIAAAGAETERDLRQLDELHRRTNQLSTQRDGVTAQISVALAGQFTEEAIADEISQHGPGQLEQRRDELTAQIANCQSRLSQLHERRGEAAQEIKLLLADRRLAETRLELGCVEERLKAAVRRWQMLAVAARLLESIRELYETERQPETLNEASRYLQRLTVGRYTRIWTPLGERVLRIDDEHGDPLPLEALSSGTREAVFLSLRLALAAAYARRGAMLPLVLDDVLVNFDTERAKAAAAVLIDFARSGFQMLLFTCHEHIVNIFREAHVEVRQLPVRGEVVDVPTALPDPLPIVPPPLPVEIPAPILEPAASVVQNAPEPAPEPPLRKRRRKQNVDAAATPVPPPLPRLAAETVFELEVDWNEGWWIDEDYRSPPVFAKAISEPTPVPFVPAPTPVREVPRPRLYVNHYERRFAWESPEMYTRERSEEAA